MTLFMFTACGPSEPASGVDPAPKAEESNGTQLYDTSGVTFATDHAKVSYGLGYNLGASAAQGEMEVDLQAVLAGVQDGLEFADPRVSEDELMAAFMAVQQQSMQRMLDRQSSPEAQANMERSLSWLEENASNPDVVVLDSGLQYTILETNEDDTRSPSAESVVRVHYHGTLIDGTVFDSSVDRGQPTEFPLNQVISGWTEGLQLMSVGDRWKFFIPPHLGYGAGERSRIPANSALIFEVELIDILQ